MLKKLSLVFVFLLVMAPAQADPAELSKRVEETLERIEYFGDVLGPKAGAILYDPCYVITLAELRPRARWNGLPFKSEKDRLRFARLDVISRPQGFSFTVSDRGGLAIRSLEGLRRNSRGSQFPWLSEFGRHQGWDDWADWEMRNLRAASEYAKSFPNAEAGTGFHFLEGFMLGYPEHAVKSYMLASTDPVHHRRAIDVAIAERQHLVNGQPSYSILPEDCLEPEIVEHAEGWSQFLEAFYRHPKVQERLSSQSFLEARRKLSKDTSKSSHESWLRGDDYRQAMSAGSLELNRLHETILHLHIEDLESLIESGAEPMVWALKCQDWARERKLGDVIFTTHILREWYFWGSHWQNGPRARFFEAVHRAKPRLLNSMLRQELESRKRRIRAGDDGGLWELRRANILYRHPEFQNLFPSLTEAEKQMVYSDLRKHLYTEGFKEIRKEIEAGRLKLYGVIATPANAAP